MIKRFIFSVLFTSFFSLGAVSQLQVGDWNVFSVFSGLKGQSILDTGNLVYYLSDGYLYSYDKENDETNLYSKRNYLSDIDISNIYYNYDKKYLLITYSNSNIDLLYDNGKTVNIPDLKNTIVSGSNGKGINSADFAGDEIYLATDFGYMVLDDEKYLVKESYNYGKSFYSMIANDKYIYASFDGYLYVSDKDVHHFDISSFKKTNKNYKTKLVKVNNEYAFTGTGYFRRLQIDGNQNPTEIGDVLIHGSSSSNILFVSRSKEGVIATFNDNTLVSVDSEGNTLRKFVMPTEIFSGSVMISSMESDGSFWCMDNKGIKQIDMADNGGVTYLHDNYRPNASTAGFPFYLEYDSGRLYAMTVGTNNFIDSQNNDFGLCCLDNGNWKDLASDEAPVFINSNSKGVLVSPYALNVDPDDADAVWFSTWWEGVFCMKNNKIVQRFNNSNSPMVVNYVCTAPDMKFDKYNNLWMLSMPRSSNLPILLVLPAEKRFSEVSRSDWTYYNFNAEMSKHGRLFITSDGIIIFTNNSMSVNTVLVALDYNETPENKDDDRQVEIGSFVDQDGKSFDIDYFYSFAEDKNGKIWVGTNTGLGYINRAEAFFESNFYINRVKVPRNDGTNLADYLLDGISVTDIAIDGANRKWIATNTSGLYLVSEDCTEIIEHFTTDNSYLPSNEVYSVECNPDNNTVYVGTSKGLAEYSSDAIEAEDNYNEVYAYPNPVRPDYTGYITIRGLMDNSLVKIADSAGNVVYSAFSNGGMLVWDGCNSNGKRVDTGVYFVFASQSEAGEGCVTKLMIVR